MEFSALSTKTTWPPWDIMPKGRASFASGTQALKYLGPTLPGSPQDSILP